MIPFYKIAIPHEDVLEGRLTREVFAANLGQVFKGEGPIEYRDPDKFEQQTYKTGGITDLISVVKERLAGKGGDPVIQLSTPFGGGKTHSLIAMYHEAVKLKARTSVIVGTELYPKKTTLWGLLEKQLTGSIKRFQGRTPPGSENLRDLLSEYQPVLILMDELLQYATKAATIDVGGTTLGAQTAPFMQELTVAVSLVEKAVLVFTLPSNVEEHFDETAKGLAQSLNTTIAKVTGRVKKNYLPVANHEIAQVIRHRLFSTVDGERANQVIEKFMKYAKDESLLPLDSEPSEYRKRFEVSYPFLPDTIDVLYQQWGTLHRFQRTRGVLSLLASVIHSLYKNSVPYVSYITLADFDLNVERIQQDLLEFIEDSDPFGAAIALDITGSDAGAKKVDTNFKDVYQVGFKAGTRSATTIFMHSFSGGEMQTGATLMEIKRHATTLESQTTQLKYLSSVVGDAIVQLEGKLFHLIRDNDKYYFTNRANLNSILHTKMENIEPDAINDFEDALLKKLPSSGKLNTIVWRENGQSIPDDTTLKLVILKARNDDLMEDILATKGKAQTPRDHCNTIFFLIPREEEQSAFQDKLRIILAYRAIKTDKNLKLTDTQDKKVQDDLKKAENELNAALFRYYRTVLIPTKNGFEEVNLTFGNITDLDTAVYEKLRSESVILATYQAKRIKDEWLKDNESFFTETLYHMSTMKRGASRVANQNVWVEGIRSGVKEGLFGLGKSEGGELHLLAFKKDPIEVSLSGNEVIIRDDICPGLLPPSNGEGPTEEQEDVDDEDGGGKQEGKDDSDSSPSEHTKFSRKFSVRKDKIPGITKIIIMLGENFDNFHIELSASEGQMSEQQYEKIEEAFEQLEIELDEQQTNS